MNVFAGQDGDADIEDRLGDTGVDEREGWLGHVVILFLIF